MTVWNRLTNRLSRARADQRGAVAVQFALLLLPIAILTFGLIDLSRVSVQKRQLQDAVDAATLMAARSTATTNDGLDTIGDSVLVTEMTGLGVPITDTDATFVAGANNTVVGTVNVVIQPIIANLWSSGNSTVTVTSTVMRSVNKLEVALVLDNTGSMDSYLGAVKKITALKTAAQSLVDVLAAAAGRATETDAVKVAVVPFSMTVNVGPENQAESWLQTKLPTAEYGADVFATPQDRFALLKTMGLKWSGCVESRPDPYDINDDAPDIDDKASLFVPYFAPDEPDSSYYLKLNNGTKQKYTNSVSNDWAKDVLADPNPANTSTKFFDRQGWVSKYVKANLRSGADGVDRGPNAGCGLTSILPLTNLRGATDVKVVKDKLDKMVATGNTNVAMGAIWGWHAVSPNLPLADGRPYGAKNVSKVIILLTDGDNVMSESNNANDSTYSGYGYVWQKRLKDKNGVALDTGSSATARMEAMDSRQQKVCEAAKLKGVQIYSIGVGVSAHSKTVLLACASKPDMYYDVTDAAQLTAVFNTIAGSIQNLRITK
jgi:Flp pilus assembly protein TadG